MVCDKMSVDSDKTSQFIELFSQTCELNSELGELNTQPGERSAQHCDGYGDDLLVELADIDNRCRYPANCL